MPGANRDVQWGRQRAPSSAAFTVEQWHLWVSSSWERRHLVDGAAAGFQEEAEAIEGPAVVIKILNWGSNTPPGGEDLALRHKYW